MTLAIIQYYEHEGFWSAHAFGQLDRERIQRTAELVPEGAASVLDAGCGNGLFCDLLASQRPSMRVVGVDRSQAALAHVGTEKYQRSIDQLAFPDRSFDCVCALQVLEHLPIGEYHAALREIARVARAWVIVSVPYRERLEQNATKCPECLTVFNVDLHLRTYSQERVASLLDEHGYRCELAETMGNVEWFVGQDFYRRIVYPGEQLAWRSPVCPLCGYRASTERHDARVSGPPPSLGARVFAKARSIPKAIWPKRRKPYWIVARYRRIHD